MVWAFAYYEKGGLELVSCLPWIGFHFDISMNQRMNDLPSRNMASQTIGNAFFEILGNLRGVFGSEKRVGQSLTLKYFHGVQVFAENQMH